MTIASSKLIRCSYPNCVLEEHLEGDHKLGRPDKPWGELRYINAFNYPHTRCEVCPLFQGRPMHSAIGFFSDMLGFGWALCAECARTFSPTKDTKDHGGKHEQKVAETRMSRRTHTDAPGTYHAVESAKKSAEAEAPPSPQAKVIPFRPAAKSQKLKAGVS